MVSYSTQDTHLQIDGRKTLKKYVVTFYGTKNYRRFLFPWNTNRRCFSEYYSIFCENHHIFLLIFFKFQIENNTKCRPSNSHAVVLHVFYVWQYGRKKISLHLNEIATLAWWRSKFIIIVEQANKRPNGSLVKSTTNVISLIFSPLLFCFAAFGWFWPFRSNNFCTNCIEPSTSCVYDAFMWFKWKLPLADN